MDKILQHFTLAQEDLLYKIPLLQRAAIVNPSLKLTGVPWSAPKWMKFKKSFGNFGELHVYTLRPPFQETNWIRKAKIKSLERMFDDEVRDDSFISKVAKWKVCQTNNIFTPLNGGSHQGFLSDIIRTNPKSNKGFLCNHIRTNPRSPERLKKVIESYTKWLRDIGRQFMATFLSRRTLICPNLSRMV